MDRNVSRRSFIGGLAATTAAIACESSGPIQGLAEGSSAFIGHGEGRGGKIEVEIQVDGESITSIEAISHDETPRISDVALELLPKQVIEHQTLNLDAITGATLTSMGVLAAIRDAAEQAGIADALDKAPAPKKSTETVREDADLVIVGAGMIGMTAAVEAALRGVKRVVVLEKTSNIGGNALVSEGLIYYPDAPEQYQTESMEGYVAAAEHEIDWAYENGFDPDTLEGIVSAYDRHVASGSTKLMDSPEFCALDKMFHFGDPAEALEGNASAFGWVSEMVDQTVEWFTDLSFKFDTMVGAVGWPWPRLLPPSEGICGQAYFDFFDRIIKEKQLPIELLTLTPATELIQNESGDVTGVRAVSLDGTTYEITARDGVVLSTGGCCSNTDMIAEYDESWNLGTLNPLRTDNTVGSDGSGFLMGMAAGGHLTNMESTCEMLPIASSVDYKLDGLVGDMSNFLMVNEQGKRFVDETSTRANLTRSIMEQTNEQAFIISDSTNCLISEGRTSGGASVEHQIAKGALFRADTLEELADLAGIDAASLVETVESYNRLVDTPGAIDELGRVLFCSQKAPTKIDTPPFYAYPNTWATHLITGGLAVDGEFRVLDKNDEPIQGLFAIGETSNGNAGIGPRTSFILLNSLYPQE